VDPDGPLSLGLDDALSMGAEGVDDGLSLGKDELANGSEAGAVADSLLGAVTIGSGVTVSTAAAPFGFVVDEASPDDAATRFPEQPPASATTLTHSRLTTTLYEIDPFNILHL